MVYIGNPKLGAGDPSIVGSPRVGNGLLAGSAVAALRDEVGIHDDYFLIDYPDDGAVVDELAEWITDD